MSPPLAWDGVPDGTKSLALIVDDPDAPDPKAPKHVWVHWILYNLPPETRDLFGPVAMFVNPDTPLEAEVVMAPSGPGAVRFVLTTIRVNGYAIPESLLSRFLAQVGARYPVLTKTGRELLVGVPVDGRVALVQNGVRLWTEADAARASPPF